LSADFDEEGEAAGGGSEALSAGFDEEGEAAGGGSEALSAGFDEEGEAAGGGSEALSADFDEEGETAGEGSEAVSILKNGPKPRTTLRTGKTYSITKLRVALRTGQPLLKKTNALALLRTGQANFLKNMKLQRAAPR
jgi:hypothetical protein